MAPIFRAVLPHMRVPPNTTAVAFLLQLGPDITADPDVVTAVLPRYGLAPPTNDHLLDIFTTLADLAADGPLALDPPALVHALASYGHPLDWARIIQAFDRPDRRTVDRHTLGLFVAVLAQPHAVAGLWSDWSNAF